MRRPSPHRSRLHLVTPTSSAEPSPAPRATPPAAAAEILARQRPALTRAEYLPGIDLVTVWQADGRTPLLRAAVPVHQMTADLVEGLYAFADFMHGREPRHAAPGASLTLLAE